MNTLIAIIIAYFIGSIPFGLLLTKAAGLGDVRDIGSGSIGATNVLRTGNKKIAGLTLLLDGIKGLVAVLLIKYFFPEAAQYAALAVIIGHLFPVWLKFKGGKGVVTSGGVAYGLAWPVGLCMMLTWIAVLKITRVSSLAGLVSVGSIPLYAVLFGHTDLVPLFIITGALVFWKHSENIHRLIKGIEPKVNAKP